jgi:hypothetical protein
MEQPTDPTEHSFKRFLSRLIQSVLVAELISTGPDILRHRSGIGADLFFGLGVGLILGTGLYFLDRRIAEEDRKPNML